MSESVDKFKANYENPNENSREILLNEINRFLYLYLFKGDIEIAQSKVNNLFNLSDDDLNLLKTVHFLLSDEVKDLIDVLPILMRNLAHSTKKETAVFKGIVKGKIDWNQTIKTRIEEGYNDDSLFVCQPPSKYYDLEENQLLKFLLKKIVYLKNEYLDFMNIDAELNIIDLDGSTDWQETVGYKVFQTKKILKKVYFEDVTTIKRITSKHLRKTYKNRNPLYHKLAKAFLLYEDLFISNNKEVLKELLQKRFITTLDDNRLYELYILFKLMEILPENKEIKLLHSNNDYVLKSQIDDVIITIYYQKTPLVLKEESKYLKVLDNYSINKKVKSPDIIIEFEKEGKKLYRLIEVKNSNDLDYVRESVYKVFGYFKDFEGTDRFNLVDKYPIVLIIWDGVSINEDYNPFDDEIIILNRVDFLKHLNKLIL